MVGTRRGGRGAIMQPRSDGQEGLRVMDRRASSGGMNRGKKKRPKFCQTVFSDDEPLS